MPQQKRLFAADCETDPFLHGRTPEPFIWGLHDGKEFWKFDSTKEFVDAVRNLNCVIYAHNGGKFDWIYLLPHIKETRTQIINGRYVKMKLGQAELRDSFSIIPVAMKQIQKKEIEYWKMEREHRQEHMPEIVEYLKYDCLYLWDLVDQYRRIAGKRLTIASNALAFSKKLGINPGKTNHRFDNSMRPFYFGGRTEVFQPGTHRNIEIFDIHSAYSKAMSEYHATGDSSDFYWQDDFGDMTREQIARSFIVLRCYSKGAFAIRGKEWGSGLRFPHGEAEFHITGWEYLAAKKHNLISNEQLISVCASDKTITFNDYVQHWYKFKADNPKSKDIVKYTIGKIMMNSLYGKLAQNPANYYDYKIVPAGTPICDFEPKEGNEKYCSLCNQRDKDHGWQLYLEYTDQEIHRRESLWRYKFEFGQEWVGKRIYNNVATGASITGYTRAQLLDAMHTIGIEHVIYCDTDSIVCHASAAHHRLPQTDQLGDWEYEGEGLIGHFAGKKLYGIKMRELDDNGKNKIKIASKGSKLEFEEIEKIVNGETVNWQNPAPTFSIDGRVNFVQRSIRKTVDLPSVQTQQSL